MTVPPDFVRTYPATTRLDRASPGSATTIAIPAFVKGLRDEFGAIYGLVNNAGIGTEGLLAMHNTEIEALVRLNILSPVFLTEYVVRQLMADGAGRIINMSSIIATTGLSVYGATKAAPTGLTRSLAREVGKLGITVNAIAPGFIDTALTQTYQKISANGSRAVAHCAGFQRSTMSPAWWNIS